MKKNMPLIPPFKVNYVMLSLAETKNYGHDMHNVPQAWLDSRGEGIKVAVVDTGLPVHRDLENNIIASANFTDSPIEDLIVGHSSHCTGIIAAEENGEGVVGIAPKASILIAKSLDDSGGGSDESIANGVRWSIQQDANVISMSLGAAAYAEPMFPETKKAIQEAYAAGIVIVCASGNENASKVGVPARFKECIAVGAVNSKKQRADFSNKGPELDFAAPGVDIVSTYKNQSYASLSGTSMSCPMVAGIVALILSSHKANPNSATPINCPEDVVEHLKKMCIDVGPEGFDKEYGFGIPVFGHIESIDPKPIKKSIWDQLKEFFLGFFV